MAELSHETASTQFMEAGGIRFAYRRFGKDGGLPLVLFQHFTGSMDNWDPALTNAFAKTRSIVLFDNSGVGRSSGETPNNFADMARDALTFIDALGLRQIDILGFSIGGMVAQQILFDRPQIARRVILVATGPPGGEGMSKFSDELTNIFATPSQPGDRLLKLFFSPTETSQAAGRQFLHRLGARKEDRDPPPTDKVAPAQRAAWFAWGTPQGDDYARLGSIVHPALVVNGNHDVMIPTVNSYILSQHLPNAQLIIYPDSGHGALFQHAPLFVRHAEMFLDDRSA